MKLITLIALLSIAGCGDIGSPQTAITDKVTDNFLFIHNYGYCNDTICVGESLILAERKGVYKECIVFEVTTGDTVYNGYSHASTTVNYNLLNDYCVDFGNGQTQIFNNNGTFNINWKCNRTYEVIICYE